ncbi:contactin-3-like [Crassostrea virginica]
MATHVYIVLAITIMYFPTILRCQNTVTSEVGANTCISLPKSNNTGTFYIKRSSESLCVFLNGETFPKPSAWSRPFSCNESISTLSVCFSNTMATDAGMFSSVVNDKMEYNVTLTVQYPPTVSLQGTRRTIEGETFSFTCLYKTGNPALTTVYWKKENSSNRYTGQTLRLPNVRRTESGEYLCVAENTYSSGNKGSTNSTMILDVQYPPVVSPIDDVKPVEHTNANVLCIFKPGNPNTTYVYWTKSGYSGVRGAGKTLVLNYISKTDSGTYSCIAENNYYSGGKGNDSQSFTIDVLYGPTLGSSQTLRVNESQRATLSVSITSNPPSLVSWHRGDNLLMSQESVSVTTSYTIARAQCNDTGTYQVTASNGIQSNRSTTVYLYVNCSPRLTTAGTSVTFYVGNNRYLQEIILIQSYPRPNFTLVLPNGAPNRNIIMNIYTISSNQFRLTLTRSSLKPEDYGRYVLDISNNYGSRTVSVNIIPQSKPYPPIHVLVHCGHGEGSVTWQSSYFGYEQQYSIVQFSTDNVNFVNGTRVTTENIKQEIYQTRVYNLQYGTQYFLRVLTINAHGFSTSSVKNCSIGTQKDGLSNSSTVVVGSLLGTLLLFALGAVVFLSFKYFTSAKKIGERTMSYCNLRKTIKSTDNHLYEQYTSEIQEGVSDKGTLDAKSKTKKSAKDTKCKKSEENDTRYTASPVPLQALKPPQNVKKEKLYENTKELASKVLGSVTTTKEDGKDKPQVLPKPKKSGP